MGADLFHADGRTDMMKLIAVFRNFANASKNHTAANKSRQNHAGNDVRPDRQCTHIVTLWCVRVTIIVVESQFRVHSLLDIEESTLISRPHSFT